MKNLALMLSIVLSIGVGTLAAQKTAPPAGTLANTASSSANSAIVSQVRALEQQEKTALQSLSQQMTELKGKHQSELAPLNQQLDSFNSQFESALKQLRQQYEDTRTQDEDQKAALMDEIKPGYLALYNEKKAPLAGVNSQEESI